MPTPLLKKIHIEGYKSIKYLDLQLHPLNILIGANGAGKSNFISVFRFLNQLVNANLQTYVAGGSDTFLHFGLKHTDDITLFFEFEDGEMGYWYKCILKPSLNGGFVFASEKVSSHDKKSYSQPHMPLGNGHTETTLLTLSKIPRGNANLSIVKYVVNTIKSWQIYHFHDTSSKAPVKQPCPIDDNRYLRPDASNLAAYLYLLQETQPAYYNNIADTIRLVAPFFSHFDLSPSRLNPSKIKLEWKEKGSDAYFDAHALSDGTLRFMSLATLLLQPAENMPATILLDEPELGLHPYAINILASLLRSASTQTQVILSTQSVTLVNQFDIDDLIIVERENGQSIFNRLTENQVKNWLEDYELGELWEKNVIGGRPTL